MSQKTYYVTTPIYFANDNLHIGHTYTTVAADTISRYKKMRGYDVKFLTGTDEHGQKIERKAKESGLSPQEYVDKVVVGIKELWKLMNIDYDIFIRTTDEKHQACVQKIFTKLYEKGDIYKSKYEGLYCTPCETFFTERQLVDGKCPDCGRDVEKVEEESYFFRLSKYQDRIIKLLEDNPEFIMPAARRNEMINNFLKPGLEDLCVSRTSFKWGIPVQFDKDHIVYVWMDALTNYISALGYLSGDDGDYQKYWPADVHLMAKEIVRFHTIIWPAMLMALDLPLPKQIYGHGWLVFDGGKMSKSKGNVVDPKVLAGRYGVDAIRYFLLREMSFGQDGNFSNEALLQRINSDLANDLGNLLSRTSGMINKYFDGALPDKQTGNEFDPQVIELAGNVALKAEELLEKFNFSDTLTEIWNLVRRTNKYVDETAPWILAKDPDKKEELAGALYTLAESLRIISILISPFMPSVPLEIQRQLGINDKEILTWDSAKSFGLLPKAVKVEKGEIIFPRYDIKKELEDLAAQQPASKEKEKSEPGLPEITIDEFAKVEMKVGKVIACEKMSGSKKLLKSQVQIGGEVRQIISGIAKYYTPEEMTGKKVIVVTNLKPAKLNGEMSEGMILAASDEKGGLSLLTVDGEMEDGAGVS